MFARNQESSLGKILNTKSKFFLFRQFFIIIIIYLIVYFSFPNVQRLSTQIHACVSKMAATEAEEDNYNLIQTLFTESFPGKFSNDLFYFLMHN